MTGFAHVLLSIIFQVMHLGSAVEESEKDSSCHVSVCAQVCFNLFPPSVIWKGGHVSETGKELGLQWKPVWGLRCEPAFDAKQVENYLLLLFLKTSKLWIFEKSLYIFIWKACRFFWWSVLKYSSNSILRTLMFFSSITVISFLCINPLFLPPSHS